ncbi:MAG: helix-turn-helix transcriptional regulator [Rhodocyclaceae bacterium]|nr:helix-turn-helix transcriptional regulator [Rhodocyclaceae bacterium]
MSKGFIKSQRILAEQVRGLRESKGLSQELLALEAEVDRTYVSQIERGVCNPSLLVLSKLADTLGVTSAELLQAKEQHRTKNT